MDDVKSGKSSLSFAAKLHNVSIHDRVSGEVSHGKNPGPESYLSAAEEKHLAVIFCEIVFV